MERTRLGFTVGGRRVPTARSLDGAAGVEGKLLLPEREKDIGFEQPREGGRGGLAIFALGESCVGAARLEQAVVTAFEHVRVGSSERAGVGLPQSRSPAA